MAHVLASHCVQVIESAELMTAASHGPRELGMLQLGSTHAPPAATQARPCLPSPTAMRPASSQAAASAWHEPSIRYALPVHRVHMPSAPQNPPLQFSSKVHLPGAGDSVLGAAVVAAGVVTGAGVVTSGQLSQRTGHALRTSDMVSSSLHFSGNMPSQIAGSTSLLQCLGVVVVADVVGTHEPQKIGQLVRIRSALIPFVQSAVPCGSPTHSAGSALPLQTGVVVVKVVVAVVLVAVVVVPVTVTVVPVMVVVVPVTVVTVVVVAVMVVVVTVVVVPVPVVVVPVTVVVVPVMVVVVPVTEVAVTVVFVPVVAVVVEDVQTHDLQRTGQPD